MNFLVTVRVTNFDDALDFYSALLRQPRRDNSNACLSFECNDAIKILSKDQLKPTREKHYGRTSNKPDAPIHAN